MALTHERRSARCLCRHPLSLILFSKQPVNQIQRLYAIVGIDEVSIHRQYDFFVVISDHAQWTKLPFTGLWRLHTLRYLNIYLIIRFFRNKVNLRLSDLSDIYPIVTAQQFQKYDVLNDMTEVCIPV